MMRASLIAVDANGYCWRVLPGEHWSMCPVNPDNSPVPRPLTFYAPVEMTEAQALAMVNAQEIAEALGWGDFRACSPDQIRRFEALAHAVGLNHLGQPVGGSTPRRHPQVTTDRGTRTSPLCVACGEVEVPEGVGFCPECDALWSCGEDCGCLACGPANEARGE